MTSSSSSSSFQRNCLFKKKISSSPLAPREEARRERDCQAGEAHSVGESAGRTLPGEAPEVAGPEGQFSIKYHLFFCSDNLTLARGGSRMLMASSMASTMESGLEERDTSSSSSSSRLLVVAPVDDVGWRGTDSSSMSLKREGLAAWMDICSRCSCRGPFQEQYVIS